MKLSLDVVVGGWINWRDESRNGERLDRLRDTVERRKVLVIKVA